MCQRRGKRAGAGVFTQTPAKKAAASGAGGAGLNPAISIRTAKMTMAPALTSTTHQPVRAPRGRLKAVHLLRKYNPAEWGGTETAVRTLLAGLQTHDVEPVVFCPRGEAAEKNAGADPMAASGVRVDRFRAHVPVWGLSEQQRQQLVSVGGNLLSFELFGKLLREPSLGLIHTHALNRLGGTALTVAKMRRIPLVVTIHGGLFDLSAEVHAQLTQPLRGGFEWGRIFGALLRSRKLAHEADAIITCNEREAALIRERLPRQRVFVKSHAVGSALYKKDERSRVAAAFPQLGAHPYLLVLGRLDPVKNQSWLIEQAPAIFKKWPEMRIVFAGSCTNKTYGESLRETVRELGLGGRVIFTGGLPPADPLLAGLLQKARALVLPSKSETFGLVVLEAWAAGTPVISSRTSGALELVREGENGCLFDLAEPQGFHAALNRILENPQAAHAMIERGRGLVAQRYDSTVLAGNVRALYDELIERRRK